MHVRFKRVIFCTSLLRDMRWDDASIAVHTVIIALVYIVKCMVGVRCCLYKGSVCPTCNFVFDFYINIRLFLYRLYAYPFNEF